MTLLNPQDYISSGTKDNENLLNAHVGAVLRTLNIKPKEARTHIGTAPCTKSIFEDEVDAPFFYSEIFPFPRETTTRRFFYTVVYYRDVFSDFLIVHDGCPFECTEDNDVESYWKIADGARSYFMIDVNSFIGTFEKNAQKRYDAITETNQTTRRTKDSHNQHEDITQFIENVSPALKLKQHTLDQPLKFNKGTSGFACSPQAALSIHPESKVGQNMYDDSFLKLASLQIALEAMEPYAKTPKDIEKDAAAKKAYAKTQDAKWKKKFSALEFVGGEVNKKSVREIISNCKSCISQFDPNQYARELHAVCGSNKNRQNACGANIGKPWKENFDKAKNYHLAQCKNLDADESDLFTLIKPEKAAFVAGQFKNFFLLQCYQNTLENIYDNYDVLAQKTLFDAMKHKEESKRANDGICCHAIAKIGLGAVKKISSAKMQNDDKHEFKTLNKDILKKLAHNPFTNENEDEGEDEDDGDTISSQSDEDSDSMSDGDESEYEDADDDVDDDEGDDQEDGDAENKDEDEEDEDAITDKKKRAPPVKKKKAPPAKKRKRKARETSSSDDDDSDDEEEENKAENSGDDTDEDSEDSA